MPGTSSPGASQAALDPAYATLMQSILAGFSQHQDGGESDSDSDGDEAGPSEASAGPTAMSSGGMERRRRHYEDAGSVDGAQAGSRDEEGEGGEAEQWHTVTWQPEIAMPAAAVASSSLGPCKTDKPIGLAKLTRAPIHDHRKAAKAAAKSKPDTAGEAWFGMKAQTITDDIKRDWRLLRLRAAYDPKAFYKSFDNTKIPKHFQMGTIVEAPGEFFSGRMTKKERKQTFTEELLADIKIKRDRKKRYAKLQEDKQYWAKKRKQMHVNNKRSHHRPKH